MAKHTATATVAAPVVAPVAPASALPAALAATLARAAERWATPRPASVGIIAPAAPATPPAAPATRPVPANPAAQPVPAVSGRVAPDAPRYLDSDVVVYRAPNAKRPGSQAFTYFDYYVVGASLATYLADRRMPKGRARVNVAWDLARGLIRVAPAGSADAVAAATAAVAA